MSMLKVQYIKVLKQLYISYNLCLQSYIYDRTGIIYYDLYDFDSELSK